MKLREKSWLSWWLSLLVACCLFLMWPEMDLWVALQFYQPGQNFPAKQLQLIQWVYLWAPRVGMVLTVAVLMVLILRRFRLVPVPRGVWRKSLAWLLVLILGIGIVVHEVLKNQVGKPRPNQIEQMGGTAPFVPALQLSKHCSKNCSFVSGHAAIGFALMAFGMWAAPGWRRRWWLVGLLAGSSIGFVRMAQGGHFMSDVLFSLLAVWGSCLLIRQFWLHFRFFSLRKPSATPA